MGPTARSRPAARSPSGSSPRRSSITRSKAADGSSTAPDRHLKAGARNAPGSARPMTDRSQKKLFPNPFYVVLLVSSTLFVLTALGYLVSPTAGGPGQDGGPAALARWLDRR